MAINSGDTAWVLVGAALVLLMTPGLAFFYGGMVRVKSVLNMMMMSFATIAVVSVLWVFFGYSLAFVGDHGSLIGGLDAVGLKGLLSGAGSVTGTKGDQIPTLAFVAFQMMFAIITPALISGAIADRVRFRGWLAFMTGWLILVYIPVAHWVWGGGWIMTKLKAIDFAGGTAVHLNAGAAALAVAIVAGKRIGWRKDPMRPHSLPLVLLGAGLLWFGWFGFNAGSALSAGQGAAITFVNTQVATAAACIGWLVVEWIRDGKPTTLGCASGAVAGLVAITPSCGAVTPMGAIAIGVIVGAVCALAVSLKYKLGFDDSLDVVGVHGVGGFTGSILIGVFGTAAAPSAVNGLLHGGGFGQLGRQVLANVVVAAYSFVVAFVLAKVVDKTVGFRVHEDDEVAGVDTSEHAESAYDYAVSFVRGGHGPGKRPGVEPEGARGHDTDAQHPGTTGGGKTAEGADDQVGSDKEGDKEGVPA